MKKKIPTTMRINPRIFQMYVHSSPTILNAPAIVVPAVERIPTKMMSEVPLPIPYSVILSLSHIHIILPATKIMMMPAIVR